MANDNDNIIASLTQPGGEVSPGITITGDDELVEEMCHSIEEAREESIPRFPHTDLGNAERMVYWHGDSLRYCAEWKSWLRWNNGHWVLDKKGFVNRCAKHTVRQMQADAARIEEQGDANYASNLREWGRESESKRLISAMIALASSEECIPVAPDEFDRDNMMFNVQNGTVDLRTGACTPHRRQHLNMKISPVSYESGADCPIWKKFLHQVLGEDDELVSWMQRAIGYSLTGSVGEKCFFVLYGSGNNGKSVFTETLHHIMGGYGKTADFSTFLTRKKDGPRDDLADLHGARLVNSSESERGAKLAEAFVKNITGGDMVKARHLYGKLFEFAPQFKLWFSSNYKPVIGNMDEGIWSRVRLIPFVVTIPKEKRDKNLKQKLLDESSGILNWCLEGCLKWQKEGLGESKIIKMATAEYRDEMDVLSMFIQEALNVDPEEMATKSEVYKMYQWWAERQGMKRPYTKNTVINMLAERGFKNGKHKKSGPYRDKQVVYGLSVRNTPD